MTTQVVRERRLIIGTLAGVSVTLGSARVFFEEFAWSPVDWYSLISTLWLWPILIIVLADMVIRRPSRLAAGLYSIVVLVAFLYVFDPYGHGRMHGTIYERVSFAAFTFAADVLYTASVIAAIAAVPWVIVLGFKTETRE